MKVLGKKEVELFYNFANKSIFVEYHLIVAKVLGTVVGGAVFTTVIAPLATAACADFMVVYNNVLAKSEDPMVRQHASGSDRRLIFYELYKHIHKIGEEDTMDYAGRRLDCVLGEANDPVRMY
ncbi:MAG: hypothetical protein QXK37_03245 [Candidatus Woesearchaeota archaeon]